MGWNNMLTHCWAESDQAQGDLQVEHKGSKVTSVISRSHLLPFTGIIKANVICVIIILIIIVFCRMLNVK